ncbi:MAG: hypothetical protein DRJ61_00325 [Acidobacteria bacterium]|nr:MAG: hypothetical protein DRJ61_00325 [Acidobacteriota bacterium]
MRERRHTCGTSSERIEKTPKVGVVRALQPDTGEKCGLEGSAERAKPAAEREAMGEESLLPESCILGSLFNEGGSLTHGMGYV